MINNFEKQKRLIFLTRLEIDQIDLSNIVAITSHWHEESNTACITFYFATQPSEIEIENASDVCAEIIAQFSNALLKENYITLDVPWNSLNISSYLVAYSKE